MKNIYSEKNLEGFVFDLMKYLYKTKDYYGERLSNDVLIYSMNKRYYVDEEKSNFKLSNIPVCIEENIKMEDYFEFCNKKTLALSMDSRLNEYLYYYDVPGCKEVAEKITKIFNKHGFYYEFGTNWYLYAEPKPKKESN